MEGSGVGIPTEKGHMSGSCGMEADRETGEVSGVMESFPCLADTGRSQRKAGLVSKDEVLTKN